MRGTIHVILAMLMFTAGLALGTEPAVAHAYLTGSTPVDRSTVDAMPSVVELEFSEAVQPEFSQVVVLDADGTHYEQGDPQSVDNTVTQAIDGLGAGTYDVNYRVGSVDGHPISGTVTFTVSAAAAEPAPAPTDAASILSPTATTDATATDDTIPTATTEDDDRLPTGLIAALAALVVAIAAFLAIGRRRTPGDQ